MAASYRPSVRHTSPRAANASARVGASMMQLVNSVAARSYSPRWAASVAARKCSSAVRPPDGPGAVAVAAASRSRLMALPPGRKAEEGPVSLLPPAGRMSTRNVCVFDEDLSGTRPVWVYGEWYTASQRINKFGLLDIHSGPFR